LKPIQFRRHRIDVGDVGGDPRRSMRGVADVSWRSRVSWVPMPEAMADAMSELHPMVVPISLIAATDFLVVVCIL
jgi:hypothetical protein